MTRSIWIVASTLLGLMTCLVIGQFPIEIRQGVTPSDFPNERTLFCRVNSASGIYNPIENAIFYLNGNDVRQELTGSEFEYSGSAGRIIIQLRQDLEGDYTCGNEDGTTTSSESVTLVYFPSRDPDLDLYHVVAVGEEAVLPCGVNQGPLASRYTVKWYHVANFDDIFLRLIDTQSVGSRYRLKSEVLQDFSLIIADTFLSDSNRYHCEVEVEIDAGSPRIVDSGDTVLVELLVSDRPMITYMTDDIIPFISTATDVEFVCNATGSPNLIVTWFHKDKKIVPNEKYSVESDTSTDATIHSRLTIKNAEITDSGSVTCMASITFQADSDGAEEDTLSRSRTAQLVVLDDSLILQPFVTRESHLLVDISLRDVFLDQNMKILVRIINYVNQSQTRVIPVQGEYSRSTTLYPFIPNSQLPKVEEGFHKFRIQVALIINGMIGPYSPRTEDLHEQVPVDLSKDPTVGPLTPTETDDTMIIATSAAGAAAVVIIAIVIVVAIGICCKFKTVRYARRQESRERKMDIVSDQLTMLYDLLGTPTTSEQLAIIEKEIDRNNKYIRGTKRDPGLIRVDGATETATGPTKESLRKQIEELKEAAAKKKSEYGCKKQHSFLRCRTECCENESTL